MLEVSAELVNELPVCTGVPPDAEVYQLMVAPGSAVAVKEAVSPEHMVLLEGVTTGAEGAAFMVTTAGLLDTRLVQLPIVASA